MIPKTILELLVMVEKDEHGTPRKDYQKLTVSSEEGVISIPTCIAKTKEEAKRAMKLFLCNLVDEAEFTLTEGSRVHREFTAQTFDRDRKQLDI